MRKYKRNGEDELIDDDEIEQVNVCDECGAELLRRAIPISIDGAPVKEVCRDCLVDGVEVSAEWHPDRDLNPLNKKSPTTFKDCLVVDVPYAGYDQDEIWDGKRA